MNLQSTALRRAIVAGAVTCAAALGPAVALAAQGTQAGAAATPSCATSGLDVWLNTQGNGAAGTIYYNLEFTNMSGSTCTLYGYPGVSGVTLAGSQIGSPASRSGVAPHTVTLANGATATAVLGIASTGVFPPAQCGPATAAGLRIYPPNQTQSRVVPFPFTACSKSSALYLRIDPMQS